MTRNNERLTLTNMTNISTAFSGAGRPSEHEERQPFDTARTKQAPPREVARKSMPERHTDVNVIRADEPQMCADYVTDIHEHLRGSEYHGKVDPRYLERVQTDVNATMRGILVDWLIEVAEEYKLTPDTLFLSVKYIDCCLSVCAVARTQLQLVGVTCMLIASKYEEIYAPQVDEFCYITDNTYTREDVLLMERTVLDALDFELTQPTTRLFLRQYLQAAECDIKVDFFANFLAELALLDYKLLKFSPSILAAATLYLALETLGNCPWSPNLVHQTGIREDYLIECVAELRRCHISASKSSLRAAREKYAHTKYHCVSRVELKGPVSWN